MEDGRGRMVQLVSGSPTETSYGRNSFPDFIDQMFVLPLVLGLALVLLIRCNDIFQKPAFSDSCCHFLIVVVPYKFLCQL